MIFRFAAPNAEQPKIVKQASSGAYIRCERFLRKSALLAAIMAFPTLGHSESYTFTTVAGAPGGFYPIDGTNQNARFSTVPGVALDGIGNLFVTDAENSIVRKVTKCGEDWVVSTIAGLADTYGTADGTNSQASIATDAAGNIYISDNSQNTIRKISPIGTDWVVRTIAGLAETRGSTDGLGTDARFNGPGAIAIDRNGNVYVGDAGNGIRKLMPLGNDYVVSTLTTLVNGTNVTGLAAPNGIVVSDTGDLYTTHIETIRQLTQIGAYWVSTTIAGLAGDRTDVDGTNTSARFSSSTGIAMDTNGNLYITENASIIRKMTRSGNDWIVSTIGGLAWTEGSADGTNTEARFTRPYGIAVDNRGIVFVADSGNSEIRKGVLNGALPDNQYPIALCKTIFLIAGTNGMADGSIDNSSFDPDGDEITITQVPSGPYPIGTNIVTLTVTDFKGASSFCEGAVMVFDGTPPWLKTREEASGFDIGGKVGQIIIVERSTDLLNWIPVQTNAAGTTPSFYNDSASLNLDHRFYRLRLWP
jgi:hypothetical protein